MVFLQNIDFEGTEGCGCSIPLDVTGGVAPYTFSVYDGSLPLGISLDSGGHLSGTPATAGKYFSRILITDSAGRTDIDSIRFNVVSPIINHAPVLNRIGNKSINEADYFQFNISASDEDGDFLTYQVTGIPQGALFSNQNFSWTPGYNQAGIYRVVFTVSDGNLSDSEAVTIEVRNTPIADIVSVYTSNPAIQAAAGSKLLVNSMIMNQGDLTAGPFYAGVYLSKDSVITKNDLRLGECYINVLAPNAARSIYATVFIPNVLAAGTYYIGVIADYTFACKESNESNNTSSSSQILITPGFDYTITGLRGPSSAARGSTVSFSVTLENLGPYRAVGCYVGIYLS